MSEIFNDLSVIEGPISQEDRFMHLLSSLPVCQCHHCGKLGHIGWNCSERVRTKVSTSRKATSNKMKANRDETERQQQLGQ